MTDLQTLIKIRKGLSNPKHFNAGNPFGNRPHCIYGEMETVKAREDLEMDVFTNKEREVLGTSTFSHQKAMQILNKAIKRLSK